MGSMSGYGIGLWRQLHSHQARLHGQIQPHDREHAEEELSPCFISRSFGGQYFHSAIRSKCFCNGTQDILVPSDNCDCYLFHRMRIKPHSCPKVNILYPGLCKDMTSRKCYVRRKRGHLTDLKDLYEDVTNRPLCGILVRTFHQEEETIYGLFHH
jgi:hypothetical protein